MAIIRNESVYCKDLVKFILWYLKFKEHISKIDKKIERVAVKSYSQYESAMIAYNRILELMKEKYKMFLEYQKIRSFLISLKEDERHLLLDYCTSKSPVVEISKKYEIAPRTLYRKIQSINQKYTRLYREDKSKDEIICY